MRRASPSFFALALLLLGSPASGDDVSVDLDGNDGFVVRDGSDVERLRVGTAIRAEGPSHIELLVPGHGGSGTHHQAALALTTSFADGINTIPLAMEREDTNKVCWFTNGAGYICSAFLRIDGFANATYDATTGRITVIDSARILDPDGPGPALGSMGQFGADVENVLILRGGGAAPVNGRAKEKLILGLDYQEDWVWKVEDDGKTCWGSPTEKGGSSWDLCLERVDEAGFEFARFTLDEDGAPVSVDIKAPLVQGTGVATHGPLIWGDGSDPFDTGDEVCQTQGLDCQTSFTTAGEGRACDFDHGASGSYFYALCR